MPLTVDITIARRIPIINGFVEIPHATADLRNKLTAEAAQALIPGSEIIDIGQNVEVQQWLLLPAFETEDGPADDFFKILRDAAAST